MNDNVYGLIAIILVFIFFFYVNKWDLVDMTGLAKKTAIKGMPALAKRLAMQHEIGKTDIHQGE
ncbi:MAG: hypothetical protein KUG82_21380, partial [Pseudomonadales bacterium]|nr:hypothetical protein [Pseudomonadales bacterium]